MIAATPNIVLATTLALLFSHALLPDNPDAPSFRLKDLDGKTIDLQTLRGKVVVLNFWATWCGPCRAEIPGFLEVYKEYRGRGVEIIGISLDQASEEEVRSFVQRYAMDYPVAIGDASIAKLYGGIQALPTTFFIDRSGKIAGRHVGYISKQQVEMTIKKSL